MGNYNTEFEFNIKIQKQLKYDLEKLGIESDKAMCDLIVKLLQEHVLKDKSKLLYDDKFWDDAKNM